MGPVGAAAAGTLGMVAGRPTVIEMCRQVGFEQVEIVHEPARDHPALESLARLPGLWRLTEGSSRLAAHAFK